MQLLATTRLMLTWLSMCSADESTPQRKSAHIAYTLVVFSSNVVNFVASMVYCFDFFSTDFNGAIFAFMVAFGELGSIYFHLTAIRRRHQIDGIFTSLLKIYKSRKHSVVNWAVQRYKFIECIQWFQWFTDENEVTFQYLAQVNKTSEWMWKIYMQYAACTTGSVILALPPLSVLYCYSTQGHFVDDQVYRPVQIVYAIEILFIKPDQTWRI